MPRALKFVILLGVVSLFADMTYEGARSAVGPFLGMLGASAFAIGVVSGGGELVGYALRLWAGRLADRTRRYWAITFVGYALNLLAVPTLALAGNWQIAAVLVILERTGKALRAPARDAMLSYATKSTGRGWGFGLHEALDQTGATIGPLVLTVVIAQHAADYRRGFVALLVPALAALATLAVAWRFYPHPQDLEVEDVQLASSAGFPKAYWIYLCGSALVAAGYADYPLLAYYFSEAATVSLTWIPALYALAMGVDAIAALVFGRWFDRVGLSVLLIATVLSAGFAPFGFGTRRDFAVLGTILWGIGMGAQESIMRAAIANMTSPARRATAYGIIQPSLRRRLVCWQYIHGLDERSFYRDSDGILGDCATAGDSVLRLDDAPEPTGRVKACETVTPCKWIPAHGGRAAGAAFTSCSSASA
jgi:predicted MFS family arabinose efflux permease